jgi:hypothetical protein
VDRFTQLIVSGGVGILAGLWIIKGAPAWSHLCLIGTGLTTLGVGSLGYGIYRGLDRKTPGEQ